MKKLLILLLLFVTFIPGYAFGIDIRKEGTVQHGGMRMPSIERVSADYENGIITIAVKGYTGGVQVLVSDSQGNIVGYTILPEMSKISHTNIAADQIQVHALLFVRAIPYFQDDQRYPYIRSLEPVRHCTKLRFQVFTLPLQTKRVLE